MQVQVLLPVHFPEQTSAVHISEKKPDAIAVTTLPVGNRVCLVQTGGNDPPSQALQASANPSQLSLLNLAGKAGFEPTTNRLTAERTTSVLLTLNSEHKKTPPKRGLKFV